jgi:hypothetical protein
MVPAMAAMPSRAASTSAPALCGGQEASEERVELGDPILGHVDRDLLVLRGGGFCIRIHFFSYCCLQLQA